MKAMKVMEKCLSLTREGWGPGEAWPCGRRAVGNECARRIHAAYSFPTALLPHLPPLAAPNPLSVVTPKIAMSVPSFTTITTFTVFTLKALAFPHGSSWNLMVKNPRSITPPARWTGPRLRRDEPAQTWPARPR